jgi:hypothetical protein
LSIPGNSAFFVLPIVIRLDPDSPAVYPNIGIEYEGAKL